MNFKKISSEVFILHFLKVHHTSGTLVRICRYKQHTLTCPVVTCCFFKYKLWKFCSEPISRRNTLFALCLRIVGTVNARFFLHHCLTGNVSIDLRRFLTFISFPTLLQTPGAKWDREPTRGSPTFSPGESIQLIISLMCITA